MNRNDENLPEASTTDASKILDSDEYEIFENVPVFVEHTRALKSGRELHFGREELEMVAARSNRRIEETGDFAPIVIGHTKSDKSAPDPPKIGWAGPFRVGWLTKDHNKYAILADFRIDKDKASLLKEYPRRSAELWAEERYEDMYLDPISLLGADTPWSDMGVLYNRADDKHQEKIYYSIMPQAPGSYGTSLPTPIGEQSKEKERYSMEEGLDGEGPLTKEQKQIAQAIISAVFDSPEFQFLRRQMSEQSNPDSVDSAPEHVETEPSAEPVPTEPPAPVEEPTEPEGGADLDYFIQSGEEEPDSEDEPQKYEAEEGGDIGGDMGDGAEMYAADEDKVANPDETSEEDEEGDDEYDEDVYDDEEYDDEDFNDEIPEDYPEEDVDDIEDYGEDFSDAQTGDETDNLDNSTNGDDVMTLKDKVAELEYELLRLKKAFAYTTNKVVSRERYSKLHGLRSKYIFDEEAEREKCCYSKMTDAQFDERCQEIAANYRRVPTAISIPRGLVDDAPLDDNRPGAVQYSKEREADVEKMVANIASENARRGVFKTSEEIRKEVANEMNVNK